jgi:thioredoxin 1
MIIREISEKNFDKLLSENDSVFVFFRTDWCPLCNYVENILTEIEKKYVPLSLFIVDFDENKSLADKYKIIGVPTVATFEDGEMTGCLPGLYDDVKYEEIAYLVLG